MPGEGLRLGVRSKWQDPVFWADVNQIVKTVIAAVLAWVVATDLLHLPQSFLAPWSALLVVHATVYRTFSQGARQVAAAVAGVLLAWAVGNVLGLDAAAVGLVLLLGLAVGAISWLEDQGTTVAATALVVITTGFSDDSGMLAFRLLDTGIGVCIGLLVNLAVWPPLRRRTAVTAMDAIDNRIGELLIDMAEGIARTCSLKDVDGWIDRTRTIDGDLDRAWALVRQASESARMNPRRSARALRDPLLWIALLRRMEQAVAETRSMARTMAAGLADGGEWQADFRDAYVAILREAGGAITQADSDRIRATRERLNLLVDKLGEQAPAPRLWPQYGGLIINVRNIIDAMDEVAEANPMSQPPVPFRRNRPSADASASR